MGSNIPKQFLELKGKPILVHTVEKFLNFSDELKVALVLPETHFETWKKLSGPFLTPEQQSRVKLCAGGNSRTESVYKGLRTLLNWLGEDADAYVAIHDGVRPFVSHTVMENTFKDARQYGASVVCVPVKASLREKTGAASSQAVDRSRFFEVQTPQTFSLKAIIDAYDNRPEGIYTDDASVFQAVGGNVHITEGIYDNIKITTPEDMFVGEKILERGI